MKKYHRSKNATATERIRRRAKPELHMLNRARGRAKATGLDFDLTLEDIKIPDICPALNIPLDRKTRSSCPSLDRIDNNKGYVKGNVIVISYLANRIKNNASIEQLNQVTSFYNKLTGEQQ